MDIATRHRWIKDFKTECLARGHEWIEDSWLRPTGTTRGLLIGPKDAQQSKVIPFLHGLGNDAMFPMVGFFRHLLAAGWSIATCDIDGHGLGNTSTLDEEHITSCVEDFFKFIETHRPGRDRLHCLGYSFGAAVLLDYAIRNPERIHSMTMIAMPILLTKHLPIRTEASSIFRPVFYQAFQDYGVGGIIPAFGPVNRHKYPVRTTDPEVSYIQLGRQIFANLNLHHALKVATFPCLFIGSPRDGFGPLNLVTALNLPVERLQIYQIQDETHFTTPLSPLVWRRMEIFLRNVRNHQ